MKTIHNVEHCCVTSCDKPLDAAYWDAQYKTEETGWDLGMISPPLKAYIDQLVDKNIALLIPGCGNAYEAAYLLDKGFTNITLIDLSPTLIAALQQKFESNANIYIVEGDFFALQGQYDLIIEQTFFCALHPSLRQAYADKISGLLKPSGKLVGVLFDKELEFAGPPFGGCKCKYTGYFTPYFAMPIFDKCYNSHPKRKDIELFIKLIMQ